MTSVEIRQLLEEVAAGRLSASDAAERIKPLDAELGYATVDLDRGRRCGFPEVVFSEGKSADWLVGVIHRLTDAGQDCLATRVNDEQASRLLREFPSAMQDRVGRTFWLKAQPRQALTGKVAIVTAGTGDLPVAQEALVTAQALGTGAELIADVGVAGLHRLLARLDAIRAADAVVVVAGMDGALPSVVGGLVSCPVIAVPTSIGYGTSFGGLAALLTMLNACSANVVTVNIDAGFKAGYTAALIARRSANIRPA